MNGEVFIGRLPSGAGAKMLRECEAILDGLPELERLTERVWRYESGGREMKIELIPEGTGSDESPVEQQAWAEPTSVFGALHTEVSEDALRVREAGWAYMQLRSKLAARLGLEMEDARTGERYRPSDPADVAPLPALSAAADKGTVPVKLLSGIQAVGTVHYRPKAKLIAKDQPRSSYSALVALDDGRVLHGYKGGPYVTDVPGVQLREDDALDCREELTGTGRMIVPRGDGESILTDGPLSQGRRAHAVVCGLSPLSVRSEPPLPLSPPFVWVPDTEAFLAAVPRKNTSERDFPHSPPSAEVGGERLLISEEAVDGHPWLRGALDPSRYRLVEADLRSRTWRPAIGREEFAEVFGSYEGSAIELLAQSPDGRRLYVSDGYFKVACFDRAESVFVWSANLGESARVYDLALSPCGKYLAAVGLADDEGRAESLSLLHADRGDFVYRLPAYGTFRSFAYTASWHPNGRYLAVGLANGTVIEIGLDGEARCFAGLKGGITAICFHSDRMLVTGAEKAVRAWKL